MKKLLITAALCASILPANADPQTADAYAELVCDTMGTKVMDRYVISAEHLAEANESRKSLADGCKKFFLLFKDGVITKDQLNTALDDLFKGYLTILDGVFPRKRTHHMIHMDHSPS
jgi:hypothetical protein